VLIYPSPIRRAIVISTVVRQLPHLTWEVVEALHECLLEETGRLPTAIELHAYAVAASEAIDDDRLRFLLDLPRTVEPRPLAPVVPIEAAGRSGRPRGPGRPGWTAERFWERYRQARAKTPPPHVDDDVAEHFLTLDGTVGTEGDYLRKLIRRFGLPPEDRPEAG
jgi:hypothetical protein